jgi:hypothetical protein
MLQEGLEEVLIAIYFVKAVGRDDNDKVQIGPDNDILSPRAPRHIGFLLHPPPITIVETRVETSFRR